MRCRASSPLPPRGKYILFILQQYIMHRCWSSDDDRTPSVSSDDGEGDDGEVSPFPRPPRAFGGEGGDLLGGLVVWLRSVALARPREQCDVTMEPHYLMGLAAAAACARLRPGPRRRLVRQVVGWICENFRVPACMPLRPAPRPVPAALIALSAAEVGDRTGRHAVRRARPGARLPGRRDHAPWPFHFAPCRRFFSSPLFLYFKAAGNPPGPRRAGGGLEVAAHAPAEAVAHRPQLPGAFPRQGMHAFPSVSAATKYQIDPVLPTFSFLSTCTPTLLHFFF